MVAAITIACSTTYSAVDSLPVLSHFVACLLDDALFPAALLLVAEQLPFCPRTGAIATSVSRRAVTARNLLFR